MPKSRSPAAARARLAVALTMCVTLLSGCGSVDGIELNGRIFDWMGVSDSAQKANAGEPKMPARSGLVMPPDQNRLPEPGTGEEPGDVTASINDPDRRRQMAAAERARLHKAYCSGELTWKDRATKRDGAEVASSPFGPCSFIGGILKQ
jgi:hypothetical protein